MSVPALNLDHLRREVASEFGLTIEPDDPVIVSAALAVMATRELLANERAKRADENLLTYKDVRHVLRRPSRSRRRSKRLAAVLSRDRWFGIGSDQ